jgi:hypothetical protein
MSKIKRKTILRTIRLSEEVDGLLEKDAQEHNVSVNALISRIMTKYIEWDRHTERLGYVSIAKATFDALLNGVSDERLEKIAEHLATQRLKTIAMWAFGRTSFDALIRTISLVSKYGGYWSAEINCDRDCVITLHHDFGMKGSTFFGSMFDTAVRNEMKSNPTINATDDALTISFPIPVGSRTKEKQG